MLRKQGKPINEATNFLVRRSVAEKNELLFQNGINFNTLPNWQKRGIGLYWELFEKAGVNPVTNEETTAARRRIKVDFDLPMKEEYGQFISALISKPNFLLEFASP